MIAKKKAYAEYRQVRDDIKEYQIAKKNGTVKGKKRGAVATVIWDVKFKNHRGYKWWETYEADIIIK